MTGNPTEHFARRERTALCALATELGPDAGTLCEGWQSKDLVAHLVLRESHPAAVGIALKPFRGWQRHTQDKIARTSFTELVARLRLGPPWYSLMHPQPLDDALNTIEFFVHHEDVRRAQLSWKPRLLSDADQQLLWRFMSHRAKYLVHRFPVGLELRTPAHQTLRIRDQQPIVRLLGDPGELLLYLHGRRAQSNVDLLGDPDGIATLRNHLAS